MSKGWVTLEEARKLDPEFKPGWSYISRQGFISQFGFGKVRVQLKPDGMPAFDRLIVGESANINAVVWGRGKDGIVRVAITIQGRPFADDPSGKPADETIIFGQPCVMGFNLARVAGEDAAIREASEEAGTKSAVISVEYMGYHNPNPTFCATWSELLSIKVDLSKITDQVDRAELIYRAEYVPVTELLRRISVGEHEGVNYRSATANDAFFVWFAKNLIGEDLI